MYITVNPSMASETVCGTNKCTHGKDNHPPSFFELPLGGVVAALKASSLARCSAMRASMVSVLPRPMASAACTGEG